MKLKKDIQFVTKSFNVLPQAKPKQKKYGTGKKW